MQIYAHTIYSSSWIYHIIYNTFVTKMYYDREKVVSSFIKK